MSKEIEMLTWFENYIPHTTSNWHTGIHKQIQHSNNFKALKIIWKELSQSKDRIYYKCQCLCCFCLESARHPQPGSLLSVRFFQCWDDPHVGSNVHILSCANLFSVWHFTRWLGKHYGIMVLGERFLFVTFFLLYGSSLSFHQAKMAMSIQSPLRTWVGKCPRVDTRQFFRTFT